MGHRGIRPLDHHHSPRQIAILGLFLPQGRIILIFYHFFINYHSAIAAERNTVRGGEVGSMLKTSSKLLERIIIIIINPLTTKVVGAPQILRPVFSIFPVLHCPLGLAELQACPFPAVVSHLFLCPPCLLPPFTVPRKMGLARPDERET